MEANVENAPQIDPSTTTVQEMFGKVLQDRIQSGAIEIAIGKRVDDLINSVAEDVFKSYGDVGKAMKKAMSEAMVPQLENIGDIPVYHDFVINRLKLAANNFYDQRLAEVVDTELKEIFSELPEEITLTWLVEKLVEDAQSDSGDFEDQITLIIEDKTGDWSWSKPGDYVNVYLDKDADKSKNDCEFDLHLARDKDTQKYKLLGIRINGNKPGDRLSVGRIYSYEKMLFNLYTLKGLIDLDKGLDPDDYDTNFEREEGCHC